MFKFFYNRKSDSRFYRIDLIESGQVTITWIYSDFNEALRLLQLLSLTELKNQNCSVSFLTVSSDDPKIPLEDIINHYCKK